MVRTTASGLAALSLAVAAPAAAAPCGSRGILISTLARSPSYLRHLDGQRGRHGPASRDRQHRARGVSRFSPDARIASRPPHGTMCSASNPAAGRAPHVCTGNDEVVGLPDGRTCLPCGARTARSRTSPAVQCPTGARCRRGRLGYWGVFRPTASLGSTGTPPSQRASTIAHYAADLGSRTGA